MRRPQFTLKTLFWLMAAVAAISTVSHYFAGDFTRKSKFHQFPANPVGRWAGWHVRRDGGIWQIRAWTLPSGEVVVQEWGPSDVDAPTKEQILPEWPGA